MSRDRRKIASYARKRHKRERLERVLLYSYLLVNVMHLIISRESENGVFYYYYYNCLHSSLGIKFLLCYILTSHEYSQLINHP